MPQTIQERLEIEFQKRSKLNSRFSLRAFARYLGLSASVLSRILNGHSFMTVKLLKKISAPLAFSEKEFEIFKTEILERKKKQSLESLSRLQKEAHSSAEFMTLTSWSVLVVLAALKMDSDNHSEEHLAKKLGLSQKEIVDALSILINLKIVSRDGLNNLVTSSSFINISGNDFSKEMLQDRANKIAPHLQKINNLKDHSAIITACDSELLPEIKFRMNRFKLSLAEYILKNSKKRDSVYELSLSFFPWDNL